MRYALGTFPYPPSKPSAPPPQTVNCVVLCPKTIACPKTTVLVPKRQNNTSFAVKAVFGRPPKAYHPLGKTPRANATDRKALTALWGSAKRHLAGLLL